MFQGQRKKQEDLTPQLVKNASWKTREILISHKKLAAFPI